jgi:hypothetical protein
LRGFIYATALEAAFDVKLWCLKWWCIVVCTLSEGVAALKSDVFCARLQICYLVAALKFKMFGGN